MYDELSEITLGVCTVLPSTVSYYKSTQLLNLS